MMTRDALKCGLAIACGLIATTGRIIHVWSYPELTEAQAMWAFWPWWAGAIAAGFAALILPWKRG